jgi:hypothetical protein
MVKILVQLLEFFKTDEKLNNFIKSKKLKKIVVFYAHFPAIILSVDWPSTNVLSTFPSRL